MAEATQKLETVTKLVETEVEKITSVTLELTIEEASVLRSILGKLNGNGPDTHIYNALCSAGVKPDTKYKYGISHDRFGVWHPTTARKHKGEWF